MDDLEDMMMMEAIRLSLAAEEDRRKKEEKEAKKKAKKDEKENKKSEKAARKNSLFTLHSNNSGTDAGGSLRHRAESTISSLDDEVPGKGKGVERSDTTPTGPMSLDDEGPKTGIPDMSLTGASQESLASSLTIPLGSEPFKRSHLRQMSTASSASSSFVEPGASSSFPGSSTPSSEPMFNFRSLAAMIGDEEKAQKNTHIENAGDDSKQKSFENVDDKSAPVSPASSGSDQPSMEHTCEKDHLQKSSVHAETTRGSDGEVARWGLQ